MTSRRLIDRLLSPAGFALVLLAFLLPFVSVSCSNPDNTNTAVATFTGIDYVVGGEPDLVARGSDAEVQEAQRLIAEIFADAFDVEPLALLAAMVVMVAMATALVRDRLARHAVGAGLAALAAALLVAAQVRVYGRIDAAQDLTVTMSEDPVPVSEVGGAWVSTNGVGFWMAAVVLMALLLGHAGALAYAWRHPSPPAEPEPPPRQVEVTALGDEWWGREGA
jgi:hypothetical protein